MKPFLSDEICFMTKTYTQKLVCVADKNVTKKIINKFFDCLMIEKCRSWRRKTSLKVGKDSLGNNTFLTRHSPSSPETVVSWFLPPYLYEIKFKGIRTRDFYEKGEVINSRREDESANDYTICTHAHILCLSQSFLNIFLN